VLPYRENITKYCSVRCLSLGRAMRGEKHPNWKGGRIRHSMGYYLLLIPSHPFCNQSGYVPEHRVVAEKRLGRYINPKQEHVHHLDGNKANNESSNLVVLTPLEHSRTHNNWQLIDGVWWKTCRSCKRFLTFDDNFYKRGNGGSFSICIPCARRNAIDAQRRKRHEQVSSRVSV
jgi:hypothetical protein